MRILGFSRRWPKLADPEFTTFRFPRRDKDWQQGESVQVVVKPRSKKREPLGVAVIAFKEPSFVRDITADEARRDGFLSIREMYHFLKEPHPLTPINKLTIRKITPPSTKRENT